MSANYADFLVQCLYVDILSKITTKLYKIKNEKVATGIGVPKS